MCGRFTNTNPDPEKLTKQFSLDEIRVETLQPRYNIAPTQNILTVVSDDTQRHYLGAMRWGFLPSWHKDTAKLGGQINARGETVAEKPTFRAAFGKRHCLVIADGYYEWQVGEDGVKTPQFIHLPARMPFGMAGLWERWTHPTTGEVWATCTIITTAANDDLRPLHERMPVIVPPEQYSMWLNPHLSDKATLQTLLAPYPTNTFTYYPVSTQVNNARNDTPDLIAPAS